MFSMSVGRKLFSTFCMQNFKKSPILPSSILSRFHIAKTLPYAGSRLYATTTIRQSSKDFESLEKYQNLRIKLETLIKRTTNPGEKAAAQARLQELFIKIAVEEVQSGKEVKNNPQTEKNQDTFTSDLKTLMKNMAESIVMDCVNKNAFDDALAVIELLDEGKSRETLVLHALNMTMQPDKKKCFLWKGHSFLGKALDLLPKNTQEQILPKLFRFLLQEKDFHGAKLIIKYNTPEILKENLSVEFIESALKRKNYAKALNVLDNMKEGESKERFTTHFANNLYFMIEECLQQEDALEDALCLIMRMPEGETKMALIETACEKIVSENFCWKGIDRLDLLDKLLKKESFWESFIQLFIGAKPSYRDLLLESITKKYIEKKQFLNAILTVSKMKPGDLQTRLQVECFNQACAEKKYATAKDLCDRMASSTTKETLLMQLTNEASLIIEDYLKVNDYYEAICFIKAMKEVPNKELYLKRIFKEGFLDHAPGSFKAISLYDAISVAKNMSDANKLNALGDIIRIGYSCGKEYVSILIAIQANPKGEKKELLLEEFAYKSYDKQHYALCIEAIDSMEPGKRKEQIKLKLGYQGLIGTANKSNAAPELPGKY